MAEKRHRFTRYILSPVLVFVLLAMGGCGSKPPRSDQIAGKMAAQLPKIKTVMGRLDMSQGEIHLVQELWVQPPKLLRAEIEDGPPSFKGTILVLNEQEGWIYSPLLYMATVVDRTNYSPDMGLVPGSSFLETMASDVLAALQAKDSAIHMVGEEETAGRDAYHIEIVLKEQAGAFAPGTLNVWLDKKFYYPLAITTDQGLEMRFQFVKFNEEIDPLTFDFIPPPGATVNRVKK